MNRITATLALLAFLALMGYRIYQAPELAALGGLLGVAAAGSSIFSKPKNRNDGNS